MICELAAESESIRQAGWILAACPMEGARAVSG